MMLILSISTSSSVDVGGYGMCDVNFSYVFQFHFNRAIEQSPRVSCLHILCSCTSCTFYHFNKYIFYYTITVDSSQLVQRYIFLFSVFFFFSLRSWKLRVSTNSTMMHDHVKLNGMQKRGGACSVNRMVDEDGEIKI